MQRWLLGLLLLAGCDEDTKDTSDAISLNGDDSSTDAACGSTMAFVSGSVTGDSAADKSLIVTATSDSGEFVEADWYGEQGGAVAYELNLPAGSWTILADTDACAGDGASLQARACEEHTVDLVVSCR